jgi:hypothetical protein
MKPFLKRNIEFLAYFDLLITNMTFISNGIENLNLKISRVGPIFGIISSYYGKTGIFQQQEIFI